MFDYYWEIVKQEMGWSGFSYVRVHLGFLFTKLDMQEGMHKAVSQTALSCIVDFLLQDMNPYDFHGQHFLALRHSLHTIL
jgi:hypothetical protein